MKLEEMTEPQIFNALLSAAGPGEEATILINATLPGVVVPEHLKKGALWLNYSRHYSPPIPDLLVDDLGIWASLSFGGVWSKTFVPWSAVGLVQVLPEVARRAFGIDPAAPKPKLRLVSSDEFVPEGLAEAPAPAPPKLRLVKEVA